jgi:protease-4
MRFQRVIEQVYYRPWFITAAGHAAVCKLVESRLARHPGVSADVADDLKDYFVQRPPMTIENGVAHVHIFGVLGQGFSTFEKTCGATDYGDIAAEVAQAAGARALMLHIDSGGGMVEGCVETARLISSLPIPKIAHTKGAMCSAAYMLGVGCDAVYSTDSAMVGSIGVIMPWVDCGEAWQRMGLSFQPITNDGADLKSTMHGPSITAEQRAYLAEMANDCAAQFIGHVQAHREPSPEVYRAGAYTGPRALAYGLVDGLMTEAQACATLLAVQA